MSDVTDIKRVTVSFSPSAYRTLEDLAQAKGKSLSETLRDAIAHEKWLLDTREKEGARILVERNGSLREIVQI